MTKQVSGSEEKGYSVKGEPRITSAADMAGKSSPSKWAG
jgi:hypothetical protein